MEANQELPSWLEILGLETRSQTGGRRSQTGRAGRMGGPTKDVRLDNGGHTGGYTTVKSTWSGPAGSRMESNGGNYNNNGHDWWDS